MHVYCPSHDISKYTNECSIVFDADMTTNFPTYKIITLRYSLVINIYLIRIQNSRPL